MVVVVTLEEIAEVLQLSQVILVQQVSAAVVVLEQTKLLVAEVLEAEELKQVVEEILTKVMFQVEQDTVILVVMLVVVMAAVAAVAVTAVVQVVVTVVMVAKVFHLV
jgi:hypothetical protein